MFLNQKKTIPAASYRKVRDDYEAAKVVISDSVRDELSKVLLDDSNDFKDNLLNALVDVKVAALLATVKCDQEVINIKPDVNKALAKLAKPRFADGVDSIMPSLGGDMVGRGWYQPQQAGSGRFARWSGPSAVSTILIPRLVPGEYVVEGNVRFYCEGAENGFLVKLGESFVAPKLELQGERHRFIAQGTLKDTSRSSFTKIEFLCPDLASPKSKEGTSDDRLLGFFMSELNIVRV